MVKHFFSHKRQWYRVLAFVIIGLLLSLRQRALTPNGLILDPAACPQVNLTYLPAPCKTNPLAEMEQAETENPQGAAEFRRLQLQDENGQIPADGLAKAREHIRLMQQMMPDQLIYAGLDAWTSLGPINVGGRVRALVIHPTNPDIMWVGSVGGGVWKTLNGGASWFPLDDFMPNLAITTLVIDPTNPDVLYAGTGEDFYNGDGLQGEGVFKTTDGGATWTQLPATNTTDWYFVYRLTISPTNPQHLLAGTKTGIWRSEDGGASWHQKLVGPRIMDVDFNPVTETLAIASSWQGQVLYSIDGGNTWYGAAGIPTLPNPYGRVELAYAPSLTSTVYASVDRNNGELWKSTNGGQTYFQVNTGYNYFLANAFSFTQGAYDNALWVDPTNPGIVVVGGVDLWRSWDGGATLTKISNWEDPTSAHADHHIMVHHPNYNGNTNTTVFVGNDGGVDKTTNIFAASTTSGWQSLNDHLSITQFYGGAGNPTTGVIIGGSQDNRTLRARQNDVWTVMRGGDGGYAAADLTDPNYFYGEQPLLKLLRSTDGGLSADYIYSGLADAGNPYTANFVAPFALDPNNPNTLLAGGDKLWRSTDVKTATYPAWSVIKPSIGGGGRIPNLISAVAIAKGNSNIVWVGYNYGEVFMTTNGTATSPTWTQVDTNSPSLPDRMITDIVIDPRAPSTVYVTVGGFENLTIGGFSPNNVWRTTDGGTSWVDISGSGATGLPDVPALSLAISPFNSQWLYVGTETGVFATENGGAHWYPDSPANVSVQDLFWMNNKLVAATHGRGMFEAQTRMTVYIPYVTWSPPPPPTPTATQSRTPTATAIPTRTRTPAATSTNVPPTICPQAAACPTETPTRTPTPVPSATNTNVPPTICPQFAVCNTRTPTPSAPPPTNTPVWYGCELNNDFNSACGITSAVAQNFYLWPAPDQDWFWFNVAIGSGGGCIDVALTSIPTGKNYELALYSPAGTLLEQSINPGNTSEYITFPLTSSSPAGAYRVRVSASTGTDYHQTDSYRLLVATATVNCGLLHPTAQP